MTSLRDYLHNNHMSVSDFASLCGYGRSHVQDVKGGIQRPGARLVRKIEEVTNGEVTRYDLLKDDKDTMEKI